MRAPELPDLTACSTIGELPMSDFCVSPETTNEQVAALFERDPELPGVIAVQGRRIIGLAPRDKFMEQMSGQFGFALYVKRPVAALLEDMAASRVALPASCGIQEAASWALSRRRDEAFDPIAVQFEDRPPRILSTYILLLAQSRLLAMANETIKHQMQLADAASEAKSRFLANMSHEIRTPMNGVLGLTRLLLESELSPEQREYLGLIKSSADWLITVINDILDFSKIEAGKLRLEEIDFSLRRALDEMMKPMALYAQGKALKVTWGIAGEAPDAVRGDPVRLRQVIVNLVSNAIKFTAQGEVAVRVSLESCDATGARLRFSVRDTGIGIPPDRVEAIFDAFEQADGSTTRQYGGTGLGLAICRRLTLLMGSDLKVNSRLGEGSEFYFVARLDACDSAHVELSAPAAFEPEGPPRLRDSRPLRILLAEDNLVNQKVAQALLAKRGCVVTTAADGQAAVETYSRESFDVILMDVQMPNVDGFTATRMIRDREAQGLRRTPIIAMTAHAMQGDREQCLAVGMDGYVTKPIEPDELYAAIDQAAPKRRDADRRPLRPARGDAGGVVDWSAALRRLYGDEALLRSMAETFLLEAEPLFAEARAALEAADGARLRRAGHTIKGSFGYFAARGGFDAGVRLEAAAKKEDWAAAGEALEELVRIWSETEGELIEFCRQRDLIEAPQS